MCQVGSKESKNRKKQSMVVTFLFICSRKCMQRTAERCGQVQVASSFCLTVDAAVLLIGGGEATDGLLLGGAFTSDLATDSLLLGGAFTSDFVFCRWFLCSSWSDNNSRIGSRLLQLNFFICHFASIFLPLSPKKPFCVLSPC